MSPKVETRLKTKFFCLDKIFTKLDRKCQKCLTENLYWNAKKALSYLDTPVDEFKKAKAKIRKNSSCRLTNQGPW